MLLLTGLPHGQTSRANPNLFYPVSSIARPQDRGRRVHTNWVKWIGPRGGGSAGEGRGPRFAVLPGPDGGFTADELRSAYGDTGTGQGIIAIVDAFDDPNALNDFNTYSAQYGLPVETSTDQTASSNKIFQVVYATGFQPPQYSGGGWEFEEALDIEMAHAMAPNAKIILVEAATDDWDPMLAAVDKAVALGASQVSMSWIGQEFAGETAYNVHFKAPGVAFFAASGDIGGTVGYPSTSPFVFSCGATSLFLDSSGNYSNETASGIGGGGPSTVEPLPGFQQLVTAYDSSGKRVHLSRRSTPDMAAVGDPGTGVSLYDSFSGGGWTNVGGTSVSTPILAGLMNAGNAPHHLLEFYFIYHNGAKFHDIATGSNGYAAGTGYDYCTGMGTPISIGAF